MLTNENSPLNLGAMIDQLFDLREQRRVLAEQDKELKTQFDALDMHIRTAMTSLNIPLARGSLATYSIVEEVVPDVNDWDAFYEHIQQTGDFHLLQRRPAAAAFRELHAAGEVIPGLSPITLHKTNLSKI